MGSGLLKYPCPEFSQLLFLYPYTDGSFFSKSLPLLFKKLPLFIFHDYLFDNSNSTPSAGKGKNE